MLSAPGLLPGLPGDKMPPSATVTLPPIVPMPPSVAPLATEVRPVAPD
jgi:hypothetical protein